MTHKISELLILMLLIVPAIWVSPWLLIFAIVYLIHRLKKAVQRKRLLKAIKNDWFPQSKHVLFIYSNSHKWKKYFEKELLPKISKQSVVVNWSERHKNNWEDETLEAQLLKLFRPRGHFYPITLTKPRNSDSLKLLSA